MPPCQEGTLRGGIILVARDEDLAGMRICVRPEEMCLGEKLVGQPHWAGFMVRDFQAWVLEGPTAKTGNGGEGERRKGNPKPSLPQFLRGMGQGALSLPFAGLSVSSCQG